VWHAREIVVQSRAALAVERVLTRRFADEVICMSQAIADQLPRARTIVIRETADPSEFAPDRAGRFRQRIGVPDDAPLVGAAGRIDSWKGFDVLLDAFDDVAARRDDVHLVVAGGPVPGKEALFDGLQARAAGATRVHWLGVRRDVPELLADLD